MSDAHSPVLPEKILDRIDDELGETDAFLARCYPGEDARRQPVHTVYVAAVRYTADLPQRWGAAAHTENLAITDQRSSW